MIQRLRPDIVITDIRMPFMDGLELSRLIRRELPDIEIIILSGYQEFEYAKEAIKLGVAQYLSKPINGEELLAELEELSAKIEENCSRVWSLAIIPQQNYWSQRRDSASICRHRGTILFYLRRSHCAMHRTNTPAA